MNDNIQTLVVTSRHRPSLIVEYLKDIPHVALLTPDYDLPKGWTPEPKYAGLLWNATGAYRCYRGHQDAMRRLEKGAGLFFEDDAVPNRTDWTDIVVKASKLLDRFDIVSLHARQHTEADFDIETHDGLEYLVPKGKAWSVGTPLGYLVGNEAAKRIAAEPWTGNPYDLVITQNYKYCIIRNSPFDHDRRHGSLVENPK